jgi:hypothetical protein
VGVTVGVGVGVGVDKNMFNDVVQVPVDATVTTEALVSTFTLYPANN